MSKDLQKTKIPLVAQPVNQTVPAKLQQTSSQALSTLRKMELTKGLPPATIVYGTAAGAFVTFALFLLLSGHWVEGLLTLLPAGCFVGFAVHFLKHAAPPR